MEPKKPFHEAVAEKLIEQLKAGTAPWQKPWAAGESGSMPMNPTTGARYKGINAIQLMMQGRSDPRWMTYNQAQDQGAQVRKGEKSTMIQYWKFTEERIKKDEAGKPVLDEKGEKVKITVALERPKCFHANVFNAEQIDGLPAAITQKKELTWDAVERAEHILAASAARIMHAPGDRAFYRPSTDSITMPERGQFASADRYYATALHELGHWTGHPSRLDRDLSNPFGSEGYAKEELRAEISSMILGDELGIGHDPDQHAAYVGSWIKVLQEDPMEIFRAAADAEKIHKFVLAFEQKQVQDQQIGTDQVQQEASMEQGQQLPREEVSEQQRTAEQWILDNLGEKLRPAINKMNERQLDTVLGVLESMQPLGNHNSFWQRHEWAAEAMYQDVDRVEKSIWDARGWIEERSETLQEQQQQGQSDDKQQAAEQARLREEQVRQNPSSTEEDISSAKEARKDAEVAALLDDQDLQRRIEAEKKAQAQVSESLAKEKTWLAIPYEQREAAKQAAGKLPNGRPAIGFDKQTKCWYAQPGANLDKLKEWMPENQARQEPAMEPKVEFAQAMREAGLVVDGGHPIMDGKWHRVPVEGGSKGNTSGAYRGFELEPGERGVPAGTIQNHRTGFKTNWKSKGYAINDGEKAAFQAEAAKRQVEREQERQAAQTRAVKAIGEMLAIAPAAPAEHAYLSNKQVRPGDLKVVPNDTTGLPVDSIILIGKTAKESKALREAHPDHLVFTAGDLLLTAQDADGQLKSAQSVRANGTKMFVKGTEKYQNFHVVGGAGLEALETAPAIVIAEGYATADTLSQSLGHATVAAFDSGNLLHVAKQLREKFPDKPFVIAGDNDLHQELLDGKNPGRTKAQEAAKAVDGKAILPIFAPGEQAYPAGAEPIDQDKARAGKLTPEQQEAINRMKCFTDFNDLATKSSLGREAVDRQVRAEVSLTIEKHQQRIEQQRLERVQTQRETQQPRRAMSR